MSISDLYDRTMSIYTQGYTTNQLGERVKTETLLASSIPCRLRRLSGRDSIYMDNINAYITVRIYCDPRSDFEEWDYLLVDNKKYKVYSAPIIHDFDSEHHMEVDCYIENRL